MVPYPLPVPVELLEAIVSHIDEPQHLLSLAQSSKLLSAIVIPHHLHYRHLRCHPGDARFWQHLIERPFLARNVRKLDIIPEAEQAELVSQHHLKCMGISASPCAGVTLVEGIRLLATALPLMVSLTALNWDEGGIGEHVFDSVISSLNTSPISLRKLSIKSTWVPSKQQHVLNMSLTPIHLSNLTHCCLKIKGVAALLPQGLMDSLIQEKNLALTHFYVDMAEGQFIPNLLKQAQWPNLRKLTIDYWNGLYEYVIPERHRAAVMCEFLARHPTLEALCIHGFNLPDNSIPENKLPSFSSLQAWCPGLEKNPQWLPATLKTQLQHCPYFFRAETLKNLQEMTSLRDCNIMGDHRVLSQIPIILPRVRRLWYKPDLVWDAAQTYQHREFLEACVEILIKLRELTHLAEFLTLYPLSASDHLIRRLAELPKLTYVEIRAAPTEECKTAEKRWITLDRDGEGRYVGYHYTEKLDDVEHANWGEFYKG